MEFRDSTNIMRISRLGMTKNLLETSGSARYNCLGIAHGYVLEGIVHD